MKLKRILAVVLALTMVLSTMSFSVFADESVTETTNVAKIGDVEYETLQQAFDAAVDGDTITVLTDIEFTKANAGYDDGTWYDGVKYLGDQSFTLDLNGHSITDAEMNDYVLNIFNKGTKDNEITIKNGTINGGPDLWAVISVGAKSATCNTVVNLGGNLIINGDGSGNTGEDVVVKARYTGTVNVLDGTTVTSSNCRYGVAGGEKYDDETGTLNIYDGAYIDMNCANGLAVCGTAIVNIYGGTIESEGWGVYTFTTGTPVVTISGGTITGEQGAVAAASDLNNDPDAGAVVNITGGTINGQLGVHIYGTTNGNVIDVVVSGGTFDTDVSNYVTEGSTVTINGTTYTMTDTGLEEAVATVDGVGYADIQEAIKAAAPSGTVEIVDDIVVDEWVMISETLTIGNGNIITLEIDGLTIDGNEHTLTINSIESAGNGGYLFFDATELNVNNLTISYAEGLVGGICLASGTISDVTFNGGIYGVFPQSGDVAIEDCTFKTNGTSIYFEEERDGLTVTGCTFDNADDVNVILLRGDVNFTNNEVVSGRTVNIVSGSPVVTGNDFNNVRLKVYAAATATVSENTINNLVFEDTENATATVFSDNTLSDEAKAALESVTDTTVATIGDEEFDSLAEAIAAANNGDRITLISDITASAPTVIEKAITLDGNGNTLTYTGSDRAIEMPNIADSDYDVTIKNLTVDCTASYCQRGINYNDQGKLTLDGVTVKGTGVTYALNLPGSSDGVNVVINNSSLSGCIALNVWGANSVVTATGSEFISVDDEPSEDYAAIVMNNDAKGNAAIDSTLTINGGEITAYCEDGVSISTAILDNAGSEITISDTTEVVGRIESAVALVAYEGSNNFYAETTLQSAIDIAAKSSNATVVLVKDFELTETVTINGNIVLDLNGKTITGKDTATNSFELIAIKPGADLTINDSVGTGKITLTAENDREWNAYSSVISNQRGKLTVNGGTIEHLGGTAMAYGIDNLTNGEGTYAETIINGGTIKSTYRAIRQFLNGTEAENILTVNGGTIEGANKSIWMQDPSKNANTGKLTVADDATLNGDVYLFVTAGSTEWPVEVSIAAEALSEDSEILTANVPVGYELVLENGYYGIENTTAGSYKVEAIADKTEVRYNNDNTADSFTVKYVAAGGEVFGAMAQFEYDTELFECKEDPNATGIIRMANLNLTPDANGETLLKELHFTVKKDVEVDTTYTFVAKYVQVVGNYDDAGAGTQNGFVENLISDDVTIIAQYDVTLDNEGSIDGNNYVDHNADYTGTINNFDENKIYTITYTMGEEEYTIEVEDETFVIENVIGNIVFTEITSMLNFELVILPDVITGYTLVMVKDGVSAGYTYNGAEMYAVERYVGLTEIAENEDRSEFVGGDILGAESVRAILIEGGVTLDEARAAIEVSATASKSLEESVDVNCDGAFWYNDAVTAHGCYKSQYALAARMNWYLSSDVNTDFMIDGDDYDDAVTAFWSTINQ